MVELSLPDLLDAQEVDRLNESLLSRVQSEPGGKWVLDLTRVNYAGSAILGMLVNFRQQVKAGRGELALCGLSTTVQEIFRACCLERLFVITRTCDDAVRRWR